MGSAVGLRNGSPQQDLLLQKEYLTTDELYPAGAYTEEASILGRAQRSMLAGIGKRLGREGRRQVACTAKPDTILAWYRSVIAQKSEGIATAATGGQTSGRTRPHGM
jgi:hypothetical protein